MIPSKSIDENRYAGVFRKMKSWSGVGQTHAMSKQMKAFDSMNSKSITTSSYLEILSRKNSWNSRSLYEIYSFCVSFDRGLKFGNHLRNFISTLQYYFDCIRFFVYFKLKMETMATLNKARQVVIGQTVKLTGLHWRYENKDVFIPVCRKPTEHVYMRSINELWASLLAKKLRFAPFYRSMFSRWQQTWYLLSYMSLVLWQYLIVKQNKCPFSNTNN